MKYPPNLSKNILKAFSSPPDRCANETNSAEAIRVCFDDPRDQGAVLNLQELCLLAIVRNWQTNPRDVNFGNAENENYFLKELNGNDLSSLTKFIKDDLFWEKKYRNTFGHPCLETGPGKWLQVFMEKHLQDWLEKINPGDNAEETLIKQLEIYSPFVHTLTMHNFQVPASTQHIPQFNIVLQNLAELKRIDLSVNVTDAGDDFVVGCSNLTESDIDSLATGIEFCDYLCDFRLSGTRLSGSMSKRLGRALEKCPNLKVLHLIECNLSDNGVISFLIGLSPESMQSIEDLDLSNNFISSNGAFQLALVLLSRRPLKKLNLRLNPIKSDGACLIFGKMLSSLQKMESINLSACSLDSSIGIILCKVLRECKSSLRKINLSVNNLGELAWPILTEMQENTTIIELDLRNSNLSPPATMVIEELIIRNNLLAQAKDD